MIRISVFTGLLPFVLLLQCPMSLLLLLYIPLLQCRCSTVVCYWSTAHVFCACLFKKCTVEGTIRPRLRAPNLKVIHGIAQSCPFKLRFLAGCYGNQMHCGRYELCAGKCTVEGTTKTILTSSLSLPTAVRRYSGTVLGSFFSSTIDTIDTIEPLSIVPNKHSTL